ncbi:putative membrane protein [Corynebacterium provencense]|uniref:Putative membrane protein n=1 Tax=Corynebacterium provencense TaxID=1737425 RepID=A0A2Z3YNB4_9CORY|nr:VTT domain-containing protein [Corynebacterium provencense]AWT25806.1 putative membrane protein [Corynebacterium provencense]
MQSIIDLYHSVTDVEHIVSAFGLVGIALVLFAETGLLIGFFLPGDSLLFVAGLFTGGDDPVFPVWKLLLVAVIFAVLGDQLGYQIGRWTGPSILRSRAARIIGEERIDKAHEFFRSRGPHAVILARFVPVIRTIVPVLAGISGMERRRFIPYNIIGGVAWACLIPVAGHFLGGIDVIRQHVDLIIVGLVALSVIPLALEWWRGRRGRHGNRGNHEIHSTSHSLPAVADGPVPPPAA